VELQLQPSVATDLWSQAHLALIGRLEKLDLSPILVYRIASLVDSAVLAMAWQWDVLNPLLLPSLTQLVTLGYSSWDVVANIDELINIDLLQYQTEENINLPLQTVYEQYRALILLSTALHSTLGTVAAVKNGFAGLGFPNVIVQEGQNSWGGNQYPSNQGWAVFRVVIPLATIPPDTDLSTLIPRMIAVANYWKPARCILDSIQLLAPPIVDMLMPAPFDFVRSAFLQTDFVSPQPSDFIVAKFEPIADAKTIVPLHNDRYYHIAVTYGQGEPHVADSGVVVNGVPISANG